MVGVGACRSTVRATGGVRGFAQLRGEARAARRWNETGAAPGPQAAPVPGPGTRPWASGVSLSGVPELRRRANVVWALMVHWRCHAAGFCRAPPLPPISGPTRPRPWFSISASSTTAASVRGYRSRYEVVRVRSACQSAGARLCHGADLGRCGEGVTRVLSGLANGRCMVSRETSAASSQCDQNLGLGGPRLGIVPDHDDALGRFGFRGARRQLRSGIDSTRTWTASLSLCAEPVPAAGSANSRRVCPTDAVERACLFWSHVSDPVRNADARRAAYRREHAATQRGRVWIDGTLHPTGPAAPQPARIPLGVPASPLPLNSSARSPSNGKAENGTGDAQVEPAKFAGRVRRDRRPEDGWPGRSPTSASQLRRRPRAASSVRCANTESIRTYRRPPTLASRAAGRTA